jgi:hypothetical protein
LKTGINFADVVTTVSPTYAREIRETPLGMGMQEALKRRRNSPANPGNFPPASPVPIPDSSCLKWCALQRKKGESRWVAN